MNEIHLFNSASFPIKIALLSFTGGTLLFASSFLIPLTSEFLILALLYIVAAALINFCLFVFLINRLVRVPELRQKTTEELIVVLSNIPIVFLYLFIIINQNII